LKVLSFVQSGEPATLLGLGGQIAENTHSGPALRSKPALESLVTVTFEEHTSETKLTIRNRFESIAYRDTIQQMGWNER
jgi:hypothetical protein